MFYLGYFMLLDALDAIGADGRSGASNVLQAASDAGFVTAADMVSVEHADFRRSALSALPWVDHFILNEIEAGKLAGTSLRTGDGPDWVGIEMAARFLLDAGVRQTVTIHFVEGAVRAERDGAAFRQGSVNLPAGFVKGATGAGDAFAAGLLWGIHESLPAAECLRLAVSSAAICLSHPATSEGMRPLGECLALADRFGFRESGR